MTIRSSAFALLVCCSTIVVGACSAPVTRSSIPSGVSAGSGATTTIARGPKDTHGGVMGVSMTDGPPNIGGAVPSAVNLGVVRVEALGANGPVTIASFATPNVVNVLNYTSGTSPLFLGSSTIPAGTYSGLRLVLDAATTTIAFGSQISPLAPASPTEPTHSSVLAGASTSIVTLDGATFGIVQSTPFTVADGATVQQTIDFNAAESIRQNADGSYTTRPALFVGPTGAVGTLSGAVRNLLGAPVSNATVVAVSSGGAVGNTAVTDATGAYALGDLPPGTWTVEVRNSYTTAAGQSNGAIGATSLLGILNGLTVSLGIEQLLSVPVILD